MSTLHLIVEQGSYELWLNDHLLTRLEGGAMALLSGAGARLRELDIEHAIERAEDWLMPFSKSFAGLQLQVRDATGRLRRQLGEQAKCTTEQLEQAFTRVHDAVAHVHVTQVTDREAVADIVLLRELAHHGRLSGIALLYADPGSHNPGH